MKSATKKIAALLLTGSVVALLSACGGGDSSTPTTTTSTAPTTPTTPTTPTAPPIAGGAGLWREATGTRYNYMLVEPDGQMWGITSVSTLSFLGSALFAEKGQLSISAGNISGTYSDIKARTCALQYTCKVAGLASSTQFAASGNKSIPQFSAALVPDWSFTGSPEASYSSAVSAGALAGTWTMEAGNPSNLTAQGTLVIGTSGSIAVANIGGCGFAGSLTPVSGKGYFRLNISSVSGSCASGISAPQINGVAFRTDVAGRPSSLHVMWHDPTMTQYFWAVGKV